MFLPKDILLNIVYNCTDENQWRKLTRACNSHLHAWLCMMYRIKHVLLGYKLFLFTIVL